MWHIAWSGQLRGGGRGILGSGPMPITLITSSRRWGWWIKRDSACAGLGDRGCYLARTLGDLGIRGLRHFRCVAVVVAGCAGDDEKEESRAGSHKSSGFSIFRIFDSPAPWLPKNKEPWRRRRPQFCPKAPLCGATALTARKEGKGRGGAPTPRHNSRGMVMRAIDRANFN